MKILLYTEDLFQPGQRGARHSGIGRYCHDLATGLAEAGSTVTVLAPFEGPRTGTPYEAMPLEGQEVRVIARARAVRRALARGAGYLLVAGDPVAHRVLAFGGAPRGVPRAAAFYGTELKALAPALGYAGLSPVGILKRVAWRRYIEAARPRIVISRYTARVLSQALGAPAVSLVVYPAVPGELLERAAVAARHDAGAVRLLAIGRISERKNQLGLVRMVAAARGAGLDVRCTLVGNVDAPEHERYAALVQGTIASEQLEHAVTLAPRASDEDKAAALDDCDAVVALSRPAGASVEGFGITVLEAAARGRPAIVSTEGGLPESIEEGATGFAIGPDDTEGFLRAVRLLADPARRAAMGTAALARVRQEFTRAAMARRFLEGIA